MGIKSVVNNYRTLHGIVGLTILVLENEPGTTFLLARLHNWFRESASAGSGTWTSYSARRRPLIDCLMYLDVL